MPSVTLPWVQALPFKMQSILFSSLRGPDTHHAPQCKRIVRWLRPVTQINADPSTEYMQDDGLPEWAAVEKELEFSSVHYFGHLLQAFEIISYKHPDHLVRGQAYDFYSRMTDLLRVRGEQVNVMDARLADK